jgi:DNA polymerase III alpha subunit
MFSSYFEDMSFNPPLDDEHTFREVFQAGDTTGIFQFEGS